MSQGNSKTHFSEEKEDMLLRREKNVSLQEIDDSSAKDARMFQMRQQIAFKNILKELENALFGGEGRYPTCGRRKRVSCRRLMTLCEKRLKRKFRMRQQELLLFVEGRVEHVCPFGTRVNSKALFGGEGKRCYEGEKRLLQEMDDSSAKERFVEEVSDAPANCFDEHLRGTRKRTFRRRRKRCCCEGEKVSYRKLMTPVRKMLRGSYRCASKLLLFVEGRLNMPAHLAQRNILEELENALFGEKGRDVVTKEKILAGEMDDSPCTKDAARKFRMRQQIAFCLLKVAFRDVRARRGWWKSIGDGGWLHLALIVMSRLILKRNDDNRMHDVHISNCQRGWYGEARNQGELSCRPDGMSSNSVVKKCRRWIGFVGLINCKQSFTCLLCILFDLH
ncbi:hypothetical protein CEXT_78561 [Caerostris extrusa]|uniref:Uncharacterized protein n=1 Tax=Caerostris extrusa TaxID=172846 RepID=A0AAV4MA34_CAEEX|nr:hypothetical protein CEXT_78561 [Caerostris extrusa]